MPEGLHRKSLKAKKGLTGHPAEELSKVNHGREEIGKKREDVQV